MSRVLVPEGWDGNEQAGNAPWKGTAGGLNGAP